MNRLIVITNRLSDQAGQREATERAVREVLTERTGDWTVSLIETHDDSPRWIIIIEGPDRTRRTWTFDRDEQEPSIVKATLERDLGHTRLPMGWQSDA